MTLSVGNLGIDGLEDVEQIGTGGSSRVYRARQADLDRVVAVKVLNPGHDQGVTRRFDRERKAMGRLSLHEGIVPVYSSGTTAHGEPYLVMPYYQNGSLQDQIDNGAMDWQTAVSYVDVAAETIAAAHEEGVVHLDLKPANILLTNHGAPRIADFGIAKLTGHSVTGGTTGGAAFTPAYSAPETFLDGETGPPSDVYGLGATLWALLVGHPPFLTPGDDSNLMAVIGRVVNNPVGDLREFTPAPICEVIERAMVKDPAARYQTAREFSVALKNAAAMASSEFPAPPQRGSLLFPEPAPEAAAVDSAETRLLTRLDEVDLPPTIASTAVSPPVPPVEPPARPLLQETAQPLPKPAGGPPPVARTPLFDTDRFRFGPILLGMLAFLGVIAVAFWALNRNPSTDASDTGVSVDDPAGPSTESPDGGASDGSSTDDGEGSTSLSSTTASTATSSTATTTTSPTSTASSTPTSSATSSPSSTTPTTDGSTSTSDSATTTSTSTSSSSSSSSSSTETTVPAPQPPTGLSAVASGDTVTLTWTPPASGPAPASYSVFRDGEFAGSVGTPSFTDSGLAPGTYSYRIRSVAENADRSELSSPASVTVEAPGPPTVAIASATPSATAIALSFSSDQCIARYRISATGPDLSPVTVAQVVSGPCRKDISDSVTGLTPGTPYDVSVVVINSADESGQAGVTVSTTS